MEDHELTIRIRTEGGKAIPRIEVDGEAVGLIKSLHLGLTMGQAIPAIEVVLNTDYPTEKSEELLRKLPFIRVYPSDEGHSEYTCNDQVFDQIVREIAGMKKGPAVSN